MSSSTALRPPYSPTPCTEVTASESCPPLEYDVSWIPLISCLADFPLEIFEIAVAQLIHHPEYNSTLILRSETIDETIFESSSLAHLPPSVPELKGLHPIRNVHRRLLPRRPLRDSALDQHCTIYGSATSHDSSVPSTLVLTPIVNPETPLPYYHPKVHHLAFRFIQPPPLDGQIDLPPPVLRIEVLPLPDTPTDLESRLYRTCLALLETLHRYGWGAMTSYKKRVIHDYLVPRDVYQDMYLLMRERHKHLIDTWQEATDPLKHVFEDIGIATYLILLWKESYPEEPESTNSVDSTVPWAHWPRPQQGFLDFGCGNGLLTHILTSEGYNGEGIDLRARTSWSHYPPSTQSHLHVHAFDPTSHSFTPDAYLRPGVFIIGNHADELTPWVPVLSTIYSASGYLSIPCCAHTFDGRFQRDKTRNTAIFPVHDDDNAFVDSLNLGGEGSNKSAYSTYRIWLASLSLFCGWKVECETLRIPSTRNWSIVGRRRTGDEAEAMRNAKSITEMVTERGVFKPRKPEGNAGAH